MDVRRAPEWQGGVDAMTVLERDEAGRATLVETENDIKVRRVKTRVRFRYEGPTHLRWSQEKGDLKSVEGSWELEELDGDRTRATYNIEVDLGRIGLLIRGPIVDVLRGQLAGARAGVTVG